MCDLRRKRLRSRFRSLGLERFLEWLPRCARICRWLLLLQHWKRLRKTSMCRKQRIPLLLVKRAARKNKRKVKPKVIHFIGSLFERGLIGPSLT